MRTKASKARKFKGSVCPLLWPEAGHQCHAVRTGNLWSGQHQPGNLDGHHFSIAVTAVVVGSAVEEGAVVVVSAGFVLVVAVVAADVVVPSGFSSVAVADVVLAGFAAGIVFVVVPEQAAVLRIITDVRIRAAVSLTKLFFMFRIFLL